MAVLDRLQMLGTQETAYKQSLRVLTKAKTSLGQCPEGNKVTIVIKKCNDNCQGLIKWNWNQKLPSLRILSQLNWSSLWAQFHHRSGSLLKDIIFIQNFIHCKPRLIKETRIIEYCLSTYSVRQKLNPNDTNALTTRIWHEPRSDQTRWQEEALHR